MNATTESMDMIRALAASELSLRARLGYVALLLASLGMLVFVVSLWIGEVALHARTHAAFAAMSGIAAAWSSFALWALATRRKLFGRDRVIAGWMAVSFTTLFVVAAGAAVFVSGGAGAAYGALATGMVMLGSAVLVLRTARRRVAALCARRAQLEALVTQSQSR